jgi:hypothetical protein
MIVWPYVDRKVLTTSCVGSVNKTFLPEELNLEVERRIGRKKWTMKFLGQTDSKIDLLSSKGYVVHEYIHVTTMNLSSSEVGRQAGRDGSNSYVTIRSYRLTYQRSIVLRIK